ncbi:MAG: beta-ketoacyl-ACP synthase [Holosporaceae bacterium]|jgi:3-oxoacyl-[acyl-carrier-protein] synthase-1|nr:beta-ketoacyl-ACP synthase [Holosporaceae bacterium]
MKLSALGIINALGSSKSEVLRAACSSSQRGLKKIANLIPDREAYFGVVEQELPPIKNPTYDFRTNRLLLHCFYQIENEWIELTSKYAPHRIGIILGSNNTGLEKFDTHIKSYFQSKKMSADLKIKWLEEGAPTEFLQTVAKTEGIAYTVSTACSSGAKVFATARNLINSDLCDAVLVGGTDDLCAFTIRGFNALGAYSSGITNPFSKNRDGINIGEGAALFIMEKNREGIEILGIGESSDAYHVTSPDPLGTGAKQSMQAAISDASLNPLDISYINLHGTGTFHNDSMESAAVKEIFGNDPICASTKSLTGHLLGAAGTTEVALCWLMLSNLNEDRLLIPHIYDGDDMEDPLTFAKSGQCKKIKYCLSNSFAFGGSNASVIIGTNDDA